MPVSQELLDILACPKCKQPVAINAAGRDSPASTCRLEYPIMDDIPVMLIDEAKPTTPTPIGDARLRTPQRPPGARARAREAATPTNA